MQRAALKRDVDELRRFGAAAVLDDEDARRDDLEHGFS